MNLPIPHGFISTSTVWVILSFACLQAETVFQAETLSPLDKLTSLKSQTPAQRFEYWLKHFDGFPYNAHGPLGEGNQGLYDQDPIYRFDSFDCTTYIETLLALSLALTIQEFESHIQQIRYKNGEVAYLTRNHIISQQWIPENTLAGYVEDVTDLFDSEFRGIASSDIKYGAWLAAHSTDRFKVPSANASDKELLKQRLQSHSKDFPAETTELVYLRIDRILEHWSTFQSQFDGIYILNIVRPDWQLEKYIGTNLNISHQGIAHISEGQVLFTHASSAGEVKTESLQEYLSQYLGHGTVKGINLLKMTGLSYRRL